MMNIGQNTRMGIDLARQGRKLEALAYLRRAVMTEPANAEVWLWLAHVSPDLNEYRNCVYQALRLEPDHPTALRMQQDLEYQAYGLPPPVLASDAALTLQQPYTRQKRWRRILILLNAILLVTVCGWACNLALVRLEDEDLNSLIPFLGQNKNIQFAVGEEAELFHFRVTVPPTWFLADSGSPTWRAQRDRLQREFPPADDAPNLWQEVEADLGTVSRDPATGEFLDSVAIVETDSERIREAPTAFATLRLRFIQPVLVDYPDNSCGSLRLMAQADQQAAPQVQVEVREREDGDCVYVSQATELTLEGTPVRTFRISIPVESNQLAIWQVSVPEVSYTEYYEATIETIIDSLRYFKPNAISPTHTTVSITPSP